MWGYYEQMVIHNFTKQKIFVKPEFKKFCGQIIDLRINY